MISGRKDIIRGRSLRIRGPVSAKDIVSNDFTESYHNITQIVAFERTFPNFAEEVFSKDILVVDDNFGSASSKELPSLVLQKLGVKAVIGKSFFSGFYKNAFNIGLLCVQANTDYIDDDNDLIIDLRQIYIQNRTRQLGIKIKPIPKYYYHLYENGGLLHALFQEGDSL